MPELPEVETVRKTLVQWLINKTIIKVDCFYPRMMKPSVVQFNRHVGNAKIIDISRKGKYLIFTLNNQWTFLSHLRMEGKYYFIGNHDELPKYAIAVFYLDNQTRLVYADTRKFGTLELFKTNQVLTTSPLQNLGIEPSDLDNQISIKNLIQSKNKAIKSILLDQTVIAGIGNIYADEILFRSRIHPQTPGKLLSDRSIKTLLIETKKVIEQAVEVGGTTIRTYHSPSGIDGLFQHQLVAYGQVGKPCPTCQTPLIKVQLHGRGTTYCRFCQYRYDKPWVIGVTGEIASGKSTLMKVAESMNMMTISSDEIVKKLYQKKSIQRRLTKMLGQDAVIDGKVNSAFVLTKITESPQVLKQLEQFIHPLVIRNIIKTINRCKAPIVMVEMPLLFKANFTENCNQIIGIEIDPKMQFERLKKRSSNYAARLIELNRFNTFKDHLHEVNILVKNNGTMLAFEQQCSRLLKKIITEHSARLT